MACLPHQQHFAPAGDCPTPVGDCCSARDVAHVALRLIGSSGNGVDNVVENSWDCLFKLQDFRSHLSGVRRGLFQHQLGVCISGDSSSPTSVNDLELRAVLVGSFLSFEQCFNRSSCQFVRTFLFEISWLIQ